MTILGRSEELVSRCVECDLAEPESLASLGGSAPGVVDGILSRGLAISFGISRIASRQPKRDALPSTSLRNPWSPGASQLKQSAGSA